MSDTSSTSSGTSTMEHSSRHREWFMLAASSVIALTALTSSRGKLSNYGKDVKWATSVMSISLALSGLAVFAHVARDKFVGTPVEGGLALLILGFWAAGLPAIMDPDNQIATSGGGVIRDANLYFFSWAAFLMSLMVFVRYTRVHMNMSSHKKTTQWATLAATSFIVMGSATRVYNKVNCGDSNSLLEGTDYCKRTKFAVALGAISGAVALALMFGARFLSRMIGNVMSVLFLVAWCFGVGYITFGGEKAPAYNNLGNLYFFTWGSFVMSTILAGDALSFLIRKFVRRGDHPNSDEKRDMTGEEVKGEDVKGDDTLKDEPKQDTNVTTPAHPVHHTGDMEDQRVVITGIERG